MEKKIIKFKDHLARLILAGEKTSTWRLFDNKNLSEGDTVDLVNSDTKEKFAEATLVKVLQKKMGELEETDFEGHEKFANDDEMYKTYQSYYGGEVGPKTVVKIIHFQTTHV